MLEWKLNVMKTNKIALIILSLGLLTTTTFTQANTASIGIGGGAIDSPYKGYGSIKSPLPYINFDNDIIYVRSLSAGYYLLKEKEQQLTVGLYYLPFYFKPGDSDDQQLKLLNKRHATLMADVTYSLSGDWGRVFSMISADVLNETKSLLLHAGYGYPITGDSWSVTPSVGIVWANDKHNDYYYGVSRNESSRSGLKYFNAKSSVTPHVQLAGEYALTKNIGLSSGIRFDFLTGDAKDSPMIADSTVTSVFMGVHYTF